MVEYRNRYFAVLPTLHDMIMKEYPEYMSFLEWLKFNSEFEDIKEEILCRQCNGKGRVICTECGNDKECPDCKGEGKNIVSVAGRVYQEHVDRDVKKWHIYREEIEKIC